MKSNSGTADLPPLTDWIRSIVSISTLLRRHVRREVSIRVAVVLGCVAGLGQHREQLVETLDGLGDTAFGDQGAVLVNQSDVVVPFCPVDATRDLQSLSSQGY
jgi:hypothetical protein